MPRNLESFNVDIDYNDGILLLDEEEDKYKIKAKKLNKKWLDWNLVKLFQWAWCLIFFIGELALFEYNIISCNYPSIDKPYYKVLLISDPQLTDQYSYEQDDGILLWWTELYSDIFMLKHYSALLRWKKIDHAFYLGDLLDGGREWDDDRWHDEFKRFKFIFSSRGHNTVNHYIVGNHDIGVGKNVLPESKKRYTLNFESTNSYLKLGDYLFISFDSPSYIGGDQETIKFVNDTAKLEGRKVILTHIPLYRSPNVGCGGVRDHRARTSNIQQGYGYQFQNLIEEEKSNNLLTTLKPEFIFSGDDHYACLVEHSIPSSQQKAIELTVPTFSWLQGSFQPGYVLLSVPKESGESLRYNLCFFHTQIRVYYFYIAFLLFFLVTLGLYCYNKRLGFGRYMRNIFWCIAPNIVFYIILLVASYTIFY